MMIPRERRVRRVRRKRVWMHEMGSDSVELSVRVSVL